MRYGFLGPETTFTHQALLQALAETPEEFAAPEPELVPFSSVATAATDLLAGAVDALMAPIENSVEGGVSGTLDVLAATDSITIVAEQTVQITFVLAAREATPLEELTTVSSHPHAQAQVQGWLRSQVPHANIAAASSTAAAARDLAVVPAALVDKVTADDSLGRYGQCPDEDEARSRVGALVQEAGASSDCVPVLTKLVTEKTAAIAQAVVSLTTSGSGVTHRFDNDAVAVVMLQGKNPSAYVVSPDRSNGQDVVAYEPGDVAHLKKGVERLVSKANRSLRSSRS